MRAHCSCRYGSSTGPFPSYSAAFVQTSVLVSGQTSAPAREQVERQTLRAMWNEQHQLARVLSKGEAAAPQDVLYHLNELFRFCKANCLSLSPACRLGDIPTRGTQDVTVDSSTRFVFCRSMLHIPDSPDYDIGLSMDTQVNARALLSRCTALPAVNPKEYMAPALFVVPRSSGDTAILDEFQTISFGEEEIGVFEISRHGTVTLQNRKSELGPASKLPCTTRWCAGV